ncbi:CAP domain-containing protein [Streptomyces sp. 549]|uniref:CAP domain-containing protein n=1 Tax=Streptomyces sp. 549 TaxID=3049076 RepID=UPI0024C29EBD|nr:CAP domain-containing protein [Streptomyces sp. 549]MDK1472166.1 CAP domain-containing protein [Streptomyces sp. 549]
MTAKKQRGRRARRRSAAFKAGAFIATACAVAGTAVVVQPEADATPAPRAEAAPAPLQLDGVKAGKLATRLENTLGEDGAGSYYEVKTKKLVVNVTNSADKRRVLKAGAVARVVKRSTEDLTEVTSSLNRTTRIPGTSWTVDPRSNQVLVTADGTVTGKKWRALSKTVEALGAGARLEKVDGEFKPFVAGGEAITTGGSRCSAGFNAVKGDESFLITAGHCTRVGANWSGGSPRQPIGPAVASSFPGDDYAVIRYDNASAPRPSEVNLHNGTSRAINNAGEAFVGQRVQRSGSTTGTHGGTVTSLNATVNYPEGRVHGLIRTNVCAQPGDSGGALFSGNTALGLTSGGSGDCRSGGVTFFQPVTEVMQRFGLSVGDSRPPKPDAEATPPRQTAPATPPTPSAPPTPSEPPASSTPPEQSGSVAAQVLRLANSERAKAGCEPLKSEARLTSAAQKHTDLMARSGVLSHTGSDGSTLSSRVKAAGYPFSAVGENIARGQRTPEQVMDGWMRSPGHRANILNCNFRDIGIGVSTQANGPWWTQNFGRTR